MSLALPYPFRARTAEPEATRESLAAELRAAGLRAGDIVVVHSSMKSLGPVAGGAATVLAALFDAVTHAGTIVMPAFTYCLAAWGLGAFDPQRTPSRTGVLSELLRHAPGAIRSWHATHSVVAWGHHATTIAAQPTHYTPLGIGSPLDVARRMGAKILLLGVGQNRNSMIHVAEALAGVPYIDIGFTPGQPWDWAYQVRADGGGGVEMVPMFQMPGSSEGFTAVEPWLEARGLCAHCRIGAAPCRLLPAAALCDAIVGLLREDPAALLRNPEPSEITRRRLAYLENPMPNGHDS